MSVKKILSTDTLETGFRAKYNETVDEIITGYEYPAAVGLQPNGYTLRLKKFGGGYIDINLQQFYFTKQQVTDLINGLTPATPLVIPVTVNSDGYFAYAYDGSLGIKPIYYVQQLIAGDEVNRFDIVVKMNAAGDTITATADFSMDNYQLVIRQ